MSPKQALIFFHYKISTCWEKNVSQGTIPILPLYFHSCPPCQCLPPFLFHPSCLFLLSNTLDSISALFVPILPANSSPMHQSLVPFPPAKTLPYFLFHLLSLPPTFQLLLVLPTSPGLSWSSCTQPPQFCTQSSQLSFRLQWHKLWEGKGKISPGTPQCWSGKGLKTESKQLQAPSSKCIQLSRHLSWRDRACCVDREPLQPQSNMHTCTEVYSSYLHVFFPALQT